MTEAFTTPESLNPLSRHKSASQIEVALMSGYEIVHAIKGRIRLRILRLANDSTYAARLTDWLTTLSGVTQVNVNSFAKSITIFYHDDTPAAGFIQGLLSSAQILTESKTAAVTVESAMTDPLQVVTQAATDWKPWFYRLAVTLLQVAGVALLVIGIVGVLLPILPGTPFLILSSFCFLAASELSSNY